MIRYGKDSSTNVLFFKRPSHQRSLRHRRFCFHLQTASLERFSITEWYTFSWALLFTRLSALARDRLRFAFYIPFAGILEYSLKKSDISEKIYRLDKALRLGLRHWRLWTFFHNICLHYLNFAASVLSIALLCFRGHWKDNICILI